MRKSAKFIMALLGMLFLGGQAFGQDAVYFGSISNQVSIGVSKILDIRKDVTFSIMQMTKSKNFSSFTISAYDKDGNEVKLNLKEDTIYHMQMDKKLYAHQQDYTISALDYQRMQRVLNDTQSLVYVNGIEYNGLAFVSILTSLQNGFEQMLPWGRGIQARVWGNPENNMFFMRLRENRGMRREMFFRYPQGVGNIPGRQQEKKQ